MYATIHRAGALGDRVPKWQDLARKLRMCTDSDVVLIFGGALLAAKPEVVFWRSKETGDWLSPCALPSDCLVSIRAREPGEILDLDRLALDRANLSEFSVAYWFVTGAKVAGELP